MVQISVTGEAVDSAPAERAVLALRVEATGSDRHDVAERVAAQHAALLRQAEEHRSSGAATLVTSAQVTTRLAPQWIDGREVRHFVASAPIDVTFTDFTALGVWCLDLVSEEDAAVDRIDWELTDATRDALLARLRTAAGEDARNRAQAYASALGLRAPVVVRLYEDGLRPGLGGGTGPGPMMRAMRAEADHGGGGFDLRPRPIRLGVALSADFEAAAP